MDTEINLPKDYINWTDQQKNRTIDQSTENGYPKISIIWDKLMQYSDDNSMTKKFVAVIIYYSKSLNYNNAIQEWILITKENKNSSKNCICSQNIEYNYFIKNKINNKILIIGSSCITKFCNDDITNMHRISSKKRKYDGDKRMCQNCCNYKISSTKENYVTFCKSCYKEGHRTPSESYRKLMNFKECTNCKLSLIKPEDSWKTLCSECYKQKKSTFRQCDICKQNNIPSYEPEWKNKCKNCYNQEQINFRECLVCKKKKIASNEPSWKDKCTNCYFKRQKLS